MNRTWRWRVLSLAVAAAVPVLGILILLNLEVDALWHESHHRSIVLASVIADIPAHRHNNTAHADHDASGTAAFLKPAVPAAQGALAKSAAPQGLNVTSELKQASSPDFGIRATTSLQNAVFSPASLLPGLPRDLHFVGKCAPNLPMPSVVMPQYVRYKETAYQLPSVREEQGVFWETPKDVVGGDAYKCEGDMPFSTIESIWQKEGAESMRNLPPQVLMSAQANVRQAYKVRHGCLLSPSLSLSVHKKKFKKLQSCET